LPLKDAGWPVPNTWLVPSTCTSRDARASRFFANYDYNDESRTCAEHDARAA
jgi:hypothetical protein